MSPVYIVQTGLQAPIIRSVHASPHAALKTAQTHCPPDTDDVRFGIPHVMVDTSGAMDALKNGDDVHVYAVQNGSVSQRAVVSRWDVE